MELRILSLLRCNSAQWGTPPQWRDPSLRGRSGSPSPWCPQPSLQPQPCPVLCCYGTTTGVGVEPAAPWAKLRSPPPSSSSHPLGHSATCEQFASPLNSFPTISCLTELSLFDKQVILLTRNKRDPQDGRGRAAAGVRARCAELIKIISGHMLRAQGQCGRVPTIFPALLCSSPDTSSSLFSSRAWTDSTGVGGCTGIGGCLFTGRWGDRICMCARACDMPPGV